MIGSFWNLCRACPSMPVDKLHSEYRSTYKWHEYRVGGVAQALGATVPGAAVPPQVPAAPVVRRAPLPSQNVIPVSNIEPAMPRRKKYPGLAYKTNEIFEAAAAGLPSGMGQSNRDIIGNAFTLDRARSMERTKYAANRGERRSKSEGPRNARNNTPRNWIDTVEKKATSPSIVEKQSFSSEYRNQFAWPRDNTPGEGGTDAEDGPKKSVSMGALKAAARRKAAGLPRRTVTTELEPLMNHTDDDDDRKKYIEDFVKEGDVKTTSRKTIFRSAIESFGRGADRDQKQPSKLKSEYKKKFRPFSHYVYEASKGTFTKCRGRAKQGDATDGGPAAGAPKPSAEEVPLAEPAATAVVPQGLPGDPTKEDTWYKEVLDLRKRAGEYKYRGWGTEMAPEHITELYSKQMDLWNQVSRRTSLSALALATSRAISKEEKEKENESKNRTSPKKPRSFKSAPPIHARIPENKVESANQKNQRKKLQGHSFDTATTEGKTNRTSARTSPRKQLNLVIGGRGPSETGVGDQQPVVKQEYRSPKRRPRSADPKPISNGPLEEKRRPSKPSGLPLNNRYSSADPNKSLHGSPKRKAGVKAKVGITIDDDAIPLRTGSAFRDHRLLDDSPVVKSPPEPTRVKSPEQMNMRSPDPVNWTVPLDTGKTFTVTQNVKNDDLIKRPGSDFKSYAGDDPHSASLSAPLDGFDTKTMSSSHQDLPSIHQPTPPKSVEISQKPYVGMSKLAKTPTSPPILTPIDETKVLDMSSIVNGGPENHRGQIHLEDSSFEMASLMKSQEGLKASEGIQKVDTAVVSSGGGQTSVAADVLEKARTRFDQFWGKKDAGNDSV